MARGLVCLALLLGTLAACIYGLICWGASGVCENNGCPSPGMVDVYKLMFFGGGFVFASALAYRA